MRTNKNRFETQGKVIGIRATPYGDTVVTLSVDQRNDIEIHPSIVVRPEVPLRISHGKNVYATGFVRGNDIFSKARNHTFHQQQYTADQIWIVNEEK